MSSVTELSIHNNKDRKVIDSGKSYYDAYPNVILSCYFCSKQDPQRYKTWARDSYEIIKPWYESVLKHNLHGIIFYDNLSDEFTQKYTTERIKFQKCILGHFSTNDERFILYYLFLSKNPYNYVLMTDVSDVTVNQDPWDFISRDEYRSKVFVGRDEYNRPSDSWYCMDIIRNITRLTTREIFNFTPKMLHYPLYNCGLLGGEYQTIMQFLEKVVSQFFRANIRINTNLMVINYILHTEYMAGYICGINRGNKVVPDKDDACTDLIFSGLPFNSAFKQYEKRPDVLLIHK